MNTYLDSRIITLTSATAKQKYNGTALSQVEFEMIGLLKEEDSIIHTEISVLSAEIPVSFYNINATNNAFKYIYNGTSVLGTTIAIGNYNATTLITAINAAILAFWGSPVVTLSISKLTGKFSFTIPSGLSFTYSGAISTTNTLLGFLNVSYTSSGTNLTAPHPANLLGAKRISICSDLLAIYSYSSLTNNLGNTLTTIEIDQPAFGLLLYKNTTNIRSKLRVTTLDIFDIELRDELGNLLDFNNCDWSITLVLDILRKVEDTADITFSSVLEGNKQNMIKSVPNSLGEVKPPIPIIPLKDDLELLSHESKK